MRTCLLILLVGCAHAGAGGTSGGFRVFYPDASARAGKHFQSKPSADCRYDDGREGHWAITGAHVESGELPPGVTIEDGAIGGVPSKAGTFAAKIVVTGVTCAGKTLPDQHVDVTLTVTSNGK